MNKPGQGVQADSQETSAAHEKRAGRRARVDVEIRVRGESEAFSGETVDISASGALLWITDERFIPRDAATDMVRFSERVAAEFGDGMELEIAGQVTRAAEVIRVTRKGEDDKSPMLVACSFAKPLKEGDWKRIGLTSPDAETGAAVAKQVDVPEVEASPPTGKTERRAYARVDRILYVEVAGDYGAYRAYALNVSCNGVLLTITDPQFAAPSEPDQLVMFTKRLGFQFRNGMIVRFLEADVSVEADVVRVSERTESGELLIVIGGKFRRVLSRDECQRLEIEPAPNAPAHEEDEEHALDAGPVVRIDGLSSTKILEMMQSAFRLEASDLHIKVGSPPRLRIGGDLMDMGRQSLKPEEVHAMALEVMTPLLAKRFDEEGDVDFAYTIDKVGRFRISVFKQRGYTGLALRLIPQHIPTIEELGLPSIAKQLAERPRGLVLVTGPTGSGKSHTLAAMINHINETRSCHVLTMEDPIEFIHRDNRAHITQREIGRDCRDFASALKRALRQDPDVILVGEMRDLETMSLALTAAETGHLVLATLHTTTAANSPDRIVDVFPPNQQFQIRQQLSDTLAGVMAQLLVPGRDDKLVLAQEVLMATDAVRALIREGKTPQLRNIMQTSGKSGMKTLEAALNQLVAEGVISLETAIAKANQPKEIVGASGGGSEAASKLKAAVADRRIRR